MRRAFQEVVGGWAGVIQVGKTWVERGWGA